MNGITTEPGSGDLLIVNGGMIIAGTESQTMEHVLLANRGEYKEHPCLGAEIRKMQHGPGGRLWCARARTMCQAAGADVSSVEMTGEGRITVR